MARLRMPLLVLGLASTALALGGCGGSGRSSPPPSVVTIAPVAVSGGAASLQGQFTRVVKAVEPSVVQIENSQGLGSGVVYDSRGDIVTNAHVVGADKSFRITLANGRRGQAKLVGSFPADDVAVIHSDMPGLRPASFADSARVQVGDIALAIGNPLGLRSSVTDGIVSSLGRTVSEGNGVALSSVIQTSAPINPGNSGGALVNLDGQVIGIPTLAATDPQLGGGAAPGIGFALASNTVKEIAPQLISRGTVVRSERAYLGVSVASNGAGVLVSAVVRGGPADKAGIRPREIIVSINGQPTPSADDLASVLAGLRRGQSASVRVIDASSAARSVRVTLGQLPGNVP